MMSAFDFVVGEGLAKDIGGLNETADMALSVKSTTCTMYISV